MGFPDPLAGYRPAIRGRLAHLELRSAWQRIHDRHRQAVSLRRAPPMTLAAQPLPSVPAGMAGDLTAMPATQGKHRRKPGLRLALAGLVLGTVTVTAMLIHLSWSYTARQNVTDVVGQLNRQIVDSIHHEVRGVLNDAWAMQEAIRSIFFQGTIKTSDEAKREFVFLALLRSQSSLSWISLGFPNGNFFGTRKVSESEIDNVEVKWDAEKQTAQRRIDYYTPDEGDIIFNNRELEPSTYDATAQVWYRRATEENGPGWNMVSDFPSSDRQAISTSTPLMIDNQFV